MDTVDSTLRGGMRALMPHSDTPRLDAELLLCRVLGVTRSALIVRAEQAVPEGQRADFAELIGRRAAGAPVAYLTGQREFWSLPLAVTADVLVPRPETESVVGLALERTPAGAPCRVLDLGTGSGAIALAIAFERPLALVTGVDLSAPALAVARHNADRIARWAAGRPVRGNAATAQAWHERLRWLHGSWFDAVRGERFDLIVANPPYLAEDDAALSTLRAEPSSALIAGPTGFEALRAIVGSAPAHLPPGGWLIVEHGADQGPRTVGLFEDRGFTEVRTHVDDGGRPRVTLGSMP